jgi:hypothetical protein
VPPVTPVLDQSDHLLKASPNLMVSPVLERIDQFISNQSFILRHRSLQCWIKVTIYLASPNLMVSPVLEQID